MNNYVHGNKGVGCCHGNNRVAIHSRQLANSNILFIAVYSLILFLVVEVSKAQCPALVQALSPPGWQQPMRKKGRGERGTREKE